MNYSEGQSFTPKQKLNITQEMLKQYAAVSYDTNPLHQDSEFAKQAGFPSTIAHGMLSMAYLGDYIRSLFPVDRFQLRKFSVRFRKITLLGDSLTCQGTVKQIRGDGTIIVSVQIINQRLEVTTDGVADLHLL